MDNATNLSPCDSKTDKNKFFWISSNMRLFSFVSSLYIPATLTRE